MTDPPLDRDAAPVNAGEDTAVKDSAVKDSAHGADGSTADDPAVELPAAPARIAAGDTHRPPEPGLAAAPLVEAPSTEAPSTEAPSADLGFTEARAETLKGLEWPRLLDALRARVATPYGPVRLAALAPLPKLGAVRHALALVAEMQDLRAARGPLPFGGVQALTGLLERAERQGRLEAEELAAVLSTQRGALQVRAELRSHPDAPGLAELAAALHPLRELEERLGAALTPTGTLNERTFPELGRLRAQIAGRRDGIHRRLEGLLRSAKLADAFQDQIYTVRGRRYVLPVKVDFKGHLPGIVHDVSASGATLFMEPQAVVEDTNALALTERLLELEQDRILRQLSWAVGEAAGALAANLDWIGRVDLAHAQAALAEGYGGSVPRVEDEGVLELRGVAHPLLLLEQRPRAQPGTGNAAGQAAPADATAGGPADEPVDDRDAEPPDAPPDTPAAAPAAAVGDPPGGGGGVVRNDVALGQDARCMVISGANTGGKTVLLKAVGLCALLVRHGMPIPARPGSRCDRFADVWADIGDQQSLETSLSTFSAQIRGMSQWLPHARAGSLVLLDEMLTGTEPAQGAALAAGVLETLLAQGALTLVTTHFGELKELAAHHAGIVNASMAFDLRRLRPTFRLQVGLPGASYAVQIARRYGLPEPIVQRAEATLAERPAALDALLVQVGERQRELEREGERQERREARHRRADEELARARANLQARERELQRRERGAIGGELRTARRRIAEVIRALQQANSLPTVSKVRAQLATLERDYEGAVTESAAPGGPAAGSTGPLEPGVTVWLPSLQRHATLEELLDDGRRARVRLGSLTLELAREALTAPPAGASAAVEGAPSGRRRRSVALATERGGATDAAAAAGGERAGEGSADIPFALSTEENTLDVRGMRLDDALEQTEQFFDRCTMKHVSPVMVIHGHGTGRLKQGLREQLQASPYVAAFRPGGAHEGRDGVTIVALEL